MFLIQTINCTRMLKRLKLHTTSKQTEVNKMTKHNTQESKNMKSYKYEEIIERKNKEKKIKQERRNVRQAKRFDWTGE